MENVIINGIKILACEEQVRLLEVAEFYKSLLYTKTGSSMVDSANNIISFYFYKYISGYGNIVLVTSLQELIDKFIKDTGMQNWISVRVLKRPIYKSTDNIVNINVYRLVYFSLWPKYLEMLKRSVDNNEESFLFRFNIPKKVIEDFYEKKEESLECFKEEVFEILIVNGFVEINGIDNGDIYTLEIS